MLQRLQCAFGTCCSARLAHVSMTSRPRMGEWFNIGKQHPNVCSKAPTPPTRPRLLMIRRRRARAPCEFDRRRRKTIRGGGGGCQRGASALRAGRNAELKPVASVLERLTPARHRIVASASWHTASCPQVSAPWPWDFAWVRHTRFRGAVCCCMCLEQWFRLVMRRKKVLPPCLRRRARIETDGGAGGRKKGLPSVIIGRGVRDKG